MQVQNNNHRDGLTTPFKSRLMRLNKNFPFEGGQEDVSQLSRNEHPPKSPFTGKTEASFPIQPRKSYWCARVLIAFVLLGMCITTTGCQREDLSDLPPEVYRQAVASFYTGLAALQVGETRYAESQLTQVTEQVPQEPAAWANLGVLAMRQNALPKAAEYLEEARQLAPDNAHIQYLLGLLARQQGQFQEAARHLRRAADLDSSNTRAIYTLAQVIQQQSEAGSSTEALQLMDRILKVQPGNLTALLERARLAAQSESASALKESVARVTRQSASWPPAAQKRLEALRQAAQASDFDRAATQVAFLKNVLKRLPAYRRDLAAVQAPASQVGEPISHFLRLPPPSPNPAPPDDSLRFVAEPLLARDTSAASWPWASSLVLTARQNPLTAEQLPSAVVANGQQVQIDTSATVPFPGGSPAAPPTPNGIAALDYNYDFTRDLALAGQGGLRLFRHDRARTFTNVTDQLGLPAAVTDVAYTGVWPADLDQEGDLDLVLARPGTSPLVLRNNGDNTFSRWALFDEATSDLRDFAWADLSGDGDPDAVFLGASGQLHTLENQRSGTFQTVALPPQASSGIRAIDAADLNRDGIIDLVALGADGTVRRFSYQAASGAFSADTIVRWPQAPALSGNARLFTADLDNNGGLDLVASTAGGGHVWLSDRQDQFRPSLGFSLDARIFSVADLNGDGRLDLVGLSEQNRPVRLVSRGAENYLAKSIRPRAARTRGDRRINPFGLGGEIEVRSGLLYQKQPISDPIVHFGLGMHERIDVARIIWPNGTVQAEFDLASDQSMLARQRLKGSCPWVFAYDGQEMGFVTDFLWRTSLGLRINAQGTAGVVHSVDWVKIQGDELAPRKGGFYDLRITADLWETHFFDHVALMAIDHPDTTEVFVDERFHLPPPTLAAHPTAPPQPVARAWDSEGQDVTDVVRKRDGRHLDSFSLGPYQGTTEEHYVEVQLGKDAPKEGPLWLLASGWTYPTDSSVNLAISQGEYPRPKGLSLEVPDGRGGWKVVQADLGFPAGKKKTILIDLTDVSFPPGEPRRLRLRTNMEIYWDRLAWAAGRPDTRLRMQRLDPTTAQLRYRGFSETRKPRRSFPETPDYSEIASTTQQWRDLVGYYTRFGDVRPLVKEIDDRYVIMNAGDELVLRFKALSPPPDGWKRDFVLIGDGWVKDGDYNTGFSKTVRPLPYHGLSRYSQPPVPLEKDSAYLKHPEDWQTYHTRYVAPRRFRTALVPD